MSKNKYLLIPLLCSALIGFALYVQHIGWGGFLYAPCPLCILQRLAYIGIAVACVFAGFIKSWQTFFHAMALIFALLGVGVALRHLWVIFHPGASCGLDPLEVWINQWAIVQWFAWLLKADGLCSASLPPIFGLSVPVWSLTWLVILTAILLVDGKKLINQFSVE